jgi:hypothetical protein
MLVVYRVVFSATFGASIPWTIGTFACKYLKPTMVVVHSCTLPVWTALLGFVMLGTVISWFTALGALFIVSGVLIVAIAKYKENKQMKVIIMETEMLPTTLTTSPSFETEIDGTELLTASSPVAGLEDLNECSTKV